MTAQAGPPMLPLSSDFTQSILALFGSRGQEWLDDLPALLDSCAQRWSLVLQPPLPGLSYNYVAPATCADGSAVVLKVGVPNKELTTEIEALRRYDGRGAVRLVQADADAGALLLERLLPGRRLRELPDDDRATTEAAQLMLRLWQPIADPGPFPTVADWGRGFQRLRRSYGGGTGPIPARLFDAAERLYHARAASMGEPALLHGDLHHENILFSETRGWLAIDPKGVVGEREYESGAFLRNPFPACAGWPDFERRTRRRLDLLAESLSFERARLLDWAFAQSVLSACWAWEDGVADLTDWLKLAQRLHDLWSQ